MDENSSEILRVLLDTVIQHFHLGILEISQDAPFQRTRTLSRDDFDLRSSDPKSLFEHALQRRVDVASLVVDLVQIKFESCQYPAFAFANPDFVILFLAKSIFRLNLAGATVRVTEIADRAAPAAIGVADHTPELRDETFDDR